MLALCAAYLVGEGCGAGAGGMDGLPLVKPVEPPDTRNPAAVALSKLGASKGGKARAAKLSDRKRRMIAKKAAEARWGKRKSN